MGCMIYGSRLRRPIINDDIILFWTFCFDKKDRREMMTSCLKSVYMHTWTDKVGNEMSVQEIMQYTGAVWHCRAHFCLLIHSKWRQHWKWNKIDAKKCRGGHDSLAGGRRDRRIEGANVRRNKGNQVLPKNETSKRYARTNWAWRLNELFKENGCSSKERDKRSVIKLKPVKLKRLLDLLFAKCRSKLV